MSLLLLLKGGGAAWTATPADALAVTDALTLDRAIVQADALAVTDQIDVSVGRVVSLADPVGITDSINPLILKLVSVNDLLTIGDGPHNFAGEVLADSPALFYEFEETSGTNADDSSTNNRDGTHQSAVVLNQPGHIGKAIDLPNTANGRVTTPYTLASSQAYTFEGIAFRDTDTGNDVLWGGAGASSNTYLMLRQTHLTSTVVNIDFTNLGVSWNYGAAMFGLLRWVHWLLTYDPVGATAELWINGVSLGVKSVVGDPFNSGAAAGNLVIGARLSGTDPFDGKMDAFAVYESVLSAARIKAHAAAALRPCVPQPYAQGGYTASISGINPSMALGVKQGDGLLLIAHSNGASMTPSGGTETWTEIVNVQAPSALARLQIWTARASQDSPTAPSIADVGTQAAQIEAFSNIKPSGQWWGTPVTDTEATSDTSLSIPGLTTTQSNSIVFFAAAMDAPVSNQTNNSTSAYSNADMPTAIELSDRASNVVGLLVQGYGEVITPGTIGATSITLGTAAQKAMAALEIFTGAAFTPGPVIVSGKGVSQDDALGITDAIASVGVYQRQIDDALALVDSITPSIGRFVSVSDALVLTDLLTFDRLVAFADALAIVDAATTAEGYTRTVADALAITDSTNALIVVLQAINDALALTDARALAIGLTVADALGVQDATASVASFLRTVADPLALTDVASPSLDISRSISDALGITDASSLVAAYARTFADPLAFTDLIALGLTLKIDDMLAINDELASQAILLRQVDDALGVTDSWSFMFQRAFTLNDVVIASDALSFAYSQLLNDDLLLQDHIVPMGSGSLSLSDTLTITDTIDMLVRLRRLFLFVKEDVRRALNIQVDARELRLRHEVIEDDVQSVMPTILTVGDEGTIDLEVQE